MNPTVHCLKLDQNLPGLPRPPYPNALGKRIHASISAQAWAEWLKYQTMLINEYRLNMTDPQAKSFLQQEAETFFFGDKNDPKTNHAN